jgi:hypothetical protein
MTKHQLSGATGGGQPSRPYSDGHGGSDVACHSLSRMPTIEPAIDFPSPPIDHFPDATIDKPWLKAEYDPDLDAASGRMLAMTVKGDMRDTGSKSGHRTFRRQYIQMFRRPLSASRKRRLV